MKGDKKEDNQSDSKQTTAGAHQITLKQDEHDPEVRKDLKGLTNNTEPDETAAKYEEVAP